MLRRLLWYTAVVLPQIVPPSSPSRQPDVHVRISRTFSDARNTVRRTGSNCHPLHLLKSVPYLHLVEDFFIGYQITVALDELD